MDLGWCIFVVLMMVFITVNANSLARSRSLAPSLIGVYKLLFRVDLTNCVDQSFPTFNAFFTRREFRKVGKRVVSPVDGRMVQVNERDNDLSTLCGGIELPQIEYDCLRFDLQPQDYHRVHLPCD